MESSKYQLEVNLPGNAGGIKTAKGWSVEKVGTKAEVLKAEKSWKFWEHKTRVSKVPAK